MLHCQSLNNLLRTTMNQQPETFDFSTAVLERAGSITLAQLLDCPSTQAWAISMVCNSVNYAHHFKHETPSDEMLDFHLSQLMRSIPSSERTQLFRTCNTMLKERKSAGKE